MAHLLFALVAVCALFLTVSVAAAQSSADEREPDAEARRLFEEGARALQAGEVDDAIRLLSRSHEILPNVANAFNLAVAFLEGGRVQESLGILTALEAGAFGSLEDNQRVAIGSRAEEARRTLSILRISASGRDNVRASVDGQDVGSVDNSVLVIDVDPGTRRVSVRSPGFAPVTQTVDAVSGQATTVEFSLSPSDAQARSGAELLGGASPSAQADLLDDEESSAGPWPWIGLAAAVVVGGAVVLALLLIGPSDPAIDTVGRVETLSPAPGIRF